MSDGPIAVGILGAGTIGASWTALFLAAGHDVDLFDPAEAGAAYVRDYIANAWPSLQKLGLGGGESAAAAAGRVRFHGDPETAVGRAGFVQESVPERIEIKHDLYRRIEPALPAGTVVATSASGLMVRELQDAWRDPSRLILAHPFNPPHLIPLVELLGNDRTDPAALDTAEAFYARCGKVTIRLRKEVPGHVANRLQAALWREAIHLVAEGVASVADVDKAISAGPGLRWAVMGPTMLFHLASGGSGLEVFCERFGPSFRRWWADLGQPELTPELIARLHGGVRAVEAGRDFEALAGERDAKLVALLKAMADVDRSRAATP